MPEEYEDRVREIAIAFHDAYEHHARRFEWETQAATRVSWDELPPENRDTMLATVEQLIKDGVIG